jgi:hypothetical protein
MNKKYSKQIFASDEIDAFSLSGTVMNSKGKPLLDCRIMLYDYDDKEKLQPLGSAKPDSKGFFAIVFNRKDFTLPQELESEGNPDLIVRIVNARNEVVFEEGPIIDAPRHHEMNITLDIKESSSSLPGFVRIDPFKELKNEYQEEIKILSKLSIKTSTELDNLSHAELEKMDEKSRTGILAFRLHSKMTQAFAFDKSIATALAASGIGTSEQLAVSRPNVLHAAIEKAVADKLITRPKDLIPSHIYGWVGYARGIDPAPFSTPMNIKAVLEYGQPLLERIQKDNIMADIIAIKGLLNPFNRLQSMAHMRGLMEAAGVTDLSSLGTFSVTGRRVITPGYYVARGNKLIGAGHLADIINTNILNAAASFSKVKYINHLPDSFHFVPNPVTDAVILGSVVSFIQDGKLIIGKDVTSLTIVTEEIRYGILNSIEYEDATQPPIAQPRMSPDRAGTNSPINNRNVYSTGEGDRGRNGGTGRNGANGLVGLEGSTKGNAPNVTIYVQRTPTGMPDIFLGGRRGGTGQPGQHGGNGSDGARGREACSGVCYCHRGVGQGGDGGTGGTGGIGGDGGSGGKGGELKINTLDNNIVTLSTTRPFTINVTGGPGGNGGEAGLSGNGGIGGAPGDDSGPWCDSEPSRVGNNGGRGSSGNRGNDGPLGQSGLFSLQPITLSDWNAVFNQPWIIRVEPSSGVVGTRVRLVCKNIASDVRVLVGSGATVVTPVLIDVPGAIVEFIVPNNTAGGNNNLQLRLNGVAGAVFSNLANFRVTPQLLSMTPDNGVPNSTITLTGTGFATGAQVRFGSLFILPSSSSATQLVFRLPDHENISLTDGPQNVVVVNPDGSESNPLVFNLTLRIRVRVKAWRVVPEFWIGGGGGIGEPTIGPSRTEQDIRDLFSGSDSPVAMWAGHSIDLVFDTNVGTAVLPSDVGSTWPIEGATVAGDSAILKATDASGNFLHFENGALNFYFVENIGDSTTWAYTFRGAENRRQEFVIFQDSFWLSDWEDKHVAAHELGHAFGLAHICSDDEPDTSFLGRACNSDQDEDFLMYPNTSFWISGEGNTVLAEESVTTRKVASSWHNL